MSTVVGPSWSRRVRRARGPLVIAGLLLLAAVVLTVLGARADAGLLQPDAPDPQGSGALVAVLREQGVRVDVVTRPEDVLAAGRDTTVLVAFPARLGTAGRIAVAHAGSDVVLVAPDGPTLEGLVPGVRATEAPPDLLTTGVVPGPGCALPAALAAGPVDLDGTVYEVTPPALGCYGTPAPLAVSGRTVVVGDPGPFTNAALDRGGNAALSMGLLGAHPRVLWYLPAPSADGEESVADLVPPGWRWGTVQLLVAGLLVVLWRGRRLGAPVAERLPVRVPAAETTRGRAALYRRLGARGRAAEVLRADARRRLAARLGVAVDETVLTTAVARASSRADAADLLYGPDPTDDASLVALARDLDDLTTGVL
ncbi:DUF4350 domain-containing protein [Actinomycetospora atypica]|uniref:DUF4350 domain-containing protein n=1 Tax=Actinomycetospora atypica TaxID=1290095 RepID=A0ABV9YQC5_9PSEU